MTPAPRGTVLIDGYCLLCQASVRFLLARDPGARLRFASLQSDAANRLLTNAGIDLASVPLPLRAGPDRAGAVGRSARRTRPEDSDSTERSRVSDDEAPGSVLFLQDGKLHRRSSAALRILATLGFPWSLVAAVWIVPRPVRDAVYDFVARRRYRWFGRSETCMVPPADYDQRFLDATETPRAGPTA